MPILVIAEHDNGSLKAATLNTVSAAAKLGGDIDVLVAGAACAGAAAAAAKLAGVTRRGPKLRVRVSPSSCSGSWPAMASARLTPARGSPRSGPWRASGLWRMW